MPGLQQRWKRQKSGASCSCTTPLHKQPFYFFVSCVQPLKHCKQLWSEACFIFAALWTESDTRPEAACTSTVGSLRAALVSASGLFCARAMPKPHPAREDVTPNMSESGYFQNEITPLKIVIIFLSMLDLSVSSARELRQTNIYTHTRGEGTYRKMANLAPSKKELFNF